MRGHGDVVIVGPFQAPRLRDEGAEYSELAEKIGQKDSRQRRQIRAEGPHTGEEIQKGAKNENHFGKAGIPVNHPVQIGQLLHKTKPPAPQGFVQSGHL